MAKKRIGLDEVDEGAEHLINNTEVQENKMTQILFKCTERQKENIKKAAKSKGLTTSGYIKNLIASDGGLN
jgi:hypothetical protein